MLYKLPVVRPVAKPFLKQAWFKTVKAWFTYKRDWELMEDYIFYCPNLKRDMKISKGFLTDFASIPRAVSVIPGMSPTGVLLAGSVPHDHIYREGFLLNMDGSKHVITSRKLSDEILRDVTVYTTNAVIIANAAYKGVRLFGESSFKSH